MEYALVLLICSSVAGNCLPPISYEDRFVDTYGCMITGYERSLEITKAIGQDEINRDGIYIKFGCNEVKQKKGIST
jgi:hypothetical protein|tara:strand:- start:163 stop:390 length:228 start_codon:yes stop_codon:yes gene_type:complete